MSMIPLKKKESLIRHWILSYIYHKTFIVVVYTAWSEIHVHTLPVPLTPHIPIQSPTQFTSPPHQIGRRSKGPIMRSTPRAAPVRRAACERRPPAVSAPGRPHHPLTLSGPGEGPRLTPPDAPHLGLIYLSAYRALRGCIGPCKAY